MPKNEQMKFRIYLDTGAVIEFMATDLVRHTDNSTGQLTGIEYEGATGNVPRYIDVRRVLAVTREVPRA